MNISGKKIYNQKIFLKRDAFIVNLLSSFMSFVNVK